MEKCCQIPDFTVCEECFVNIIEPFIDRSSQIVSYFRAAADAVQGFRCQLYSDRMWKVWPEAAAEDDLVVLRQCVAR